MNITTTLQKHTKNQQGVVLILVALLLVVLLGMVALSVDIGYLMAARNEAQNVADAAALAATRELGEEHYLELSVDEAKIRSVAREVAGDNTIANESIGITNDSDIEIGYWNTETTTFSTSPTGILTKPNSVRVTARRSDADNGAVNTFFAKVIGIDSFSVSADATAALTGASKAPEGELIPVGISKAWFEPGFCDQPIKFYPTGTIDGCAGWNTFTQSPANANYLRDTIIEGMIDDSYQSPEITVGTDVEFIGGNIANALEHPSKTDFKEVYEAKRNSTTGDWETGVVVYDWDDCSNPNTTINIIGFATAIIHSVDGSPDHTINATVICEKYNESRGGGGMYGTFGKIPNLVE